MPIVLPPDVTSTRESHILDGLNIADGVVFDFADAPVFTPGPLRLDWVGGVDSDGTVPLNAGHSDNATMSIPLRIQKQASADDTWNKVGALIAKLEATRKPGGLVDLWTPKGMTDSWEWTVRSGEIAEFPMASRGDLIGYLLRSPRFTIVLTGDPFLYRAGELIEYDEVTSSEPVFSILLENIPGHVDAEAVVTVTDNATQARHHVECGVAEDSAAPLLVDSASLITSGFAGTTTTRAGAYSASGVIRATLAPQPQAICGTGELGHIGGLLPKARIFASSTDVRIRLAYRTADGSYSYTPWVAPTVAIGWSEIDFGAITIRRVQSGAQEWDGRIEAYSPTLSDTIDIDVFYPLPNDRWWKLRTPFVYQSGVLSAFDDFAGATAGSDLDGRGLPIGTGSWDTSGATGDFQFADGPDTDEETITRDSPDDLAGGRLAQIGTQTFTDVEFSMDMRWSNFTDNLVAGALLRHSGPSYTTVGVLVFGSVGVVAGYNGGSSTDLRPNTWYRFRAIIYASGRRLTWLTERASGKLLFATDDEDPDLATGGAQESGVCMIFDGNFGDAPSERFYDNVTVGIPAPEQVAIQPNRAIEFRHDIAQRESADGTTWGTVRPRGGRAYIPCSGEDVTAYRLWAKARHNDIEAAADNQIADSTKLKVSLRPRYRLPSAP